MISVVIQSSGNENALLASLGALVPSAADGAVRDVVVVDGSDNENIRLIADGCGCVHVQAPGSRGKRLAVGARAAKGPWLLFLEPGGIPEEGWNREARAFMDRTERTGDIDRRAAVFRVVDEDLAGIFAGAVGRIGLRPGSGDALLLHRSLLDRLGGFRDAGSLEYADLAQRIGRGQLVRLHARLFVGPDREMPSGRAGRVLQVLGGGLLAARVPARILSRLYG
jgi:hypothetical protein